MKKKALRVNYDFRASGRPGENGAIKSHLQALKKAQPYMFKGIIPKYLRQDFESVNILTAACQTVALIIKASKGEGPFFFTIGETHDMPAHSIHHMLVIDGLIRKKVPFRLSLEQSYDSEIENFLKPVKQKLGKAFNQSIADNYIQDNHIIHKILNTQLSDTAPYTHIINKNYHTNLAQNGLSIDLTDAPFRKVPKAFRKIPILGKHKLVLDKRDPVLSSIIDEETRFARRVLPISFYTSLGATIRNRYTVQQIPKDQNVVHIAGLAHLFDPLRPAGKWLDGSLITEARKERLRATACIIFHSDTVSEEAQNLLSDYSITAIPSISNFQQGEMEKTINNDGVELLEPSAEEAGFTHTKLTLLGLKHIIPANTIKLANGNMDNVDKYRQDIIDLHNDAEEDQEIHLS